MPKQNKLNGFFCQNKLQCLACLQQGEESFLPIYSAETLFGGSAEN